MKALSKLSSRASINIFIILGGLASVVWFMPQRGPAQEFESGGTSIKCTVKGRIIDLPFAMLADNTLTLAANDRNTLPAGSFIPSVEIHLGHNAPGIPPEENHFKQTEDQPSSKSSAVHLISMQWPKEEGKGINFETAFDKFYAEISFGKAINNRIPGSIHLRVPKYEVEIDGTFDAAIRGFRLKNGVPDLSSDGPQVLRHASKLYLEGKLGDAVSVVSSSEVLTHRCGDRPWAGRICIQYTVAGKPAPKFGRFILEKASEWRVVHELRMDQLFEAQSEHNCLMGWPDTLLEQDLQKRHPGKMLFASTGGLEQRGEEFLWKVQYQVEGIAPDPNEEEASESAGGPKIGDWSDRLAIQKEWKIFRETWLFDLDKKPIPFEYRFVRILKPGYVLDPKVEAARRKQEHPDLSRDGIEVLEYAVRLYLEKKLGSEVEVTDRNLKETHYGKTKDQPRSYGEMCLEYKIEGKGDPKFGRFKLEKEGQWGVVEELRMDQLFPAHSSMPKIVHLPWPKLERELQSRYPGKMLFIPRSTLNPVGNQYVWELMYKVEGINRNPGEEDILPDPQTVRFKFQNPLKTFKESWLLESDSNEPNSFRYVRTLAPGEEVKSGGGAEPAKP